MNRRFCIVLILFVPFFITSCVSFQITSKNFTGDDFSFGNKDTFYLEPVKVTSYDFLENEEIGYILDRKLSFAVSSNPVINYSEKPEKSDFIISPELIIKSYEVKYTERNYYYLSLRILSNSRPAADPVSQFTYEYNGASSIFDSNVQNLIIDKFIDDFTKAID